MLDMSRAKGRMITLNWVSPQKASPRVLTSIRACGVSGWSMVGVPVRSPPLGPGWVRGHSLVEAAPVAWFPALSRACYWGVLFSWPRNPRSPSFAPISNDRNPAGPDYRRPACLSGDRCEGLKTTWRRERNGREGCQQQSHHSPEEHRTNPACLSHSLRHTLGVSQIHTHTVAKKSMWTLWNYLDFCINWSSNLIWSSSSSHNNRQTQSAWTNNTHIIVYFLSILNT